MHDKDFEMALQDARVASYIALGLSFVNFIVIMTFVLTVYSK